MRQYAYLVVNRDLRMAEVAQAIVHQSNGLLSHIDLQNVLHCACLCAFLVPIYDPLEQYLALAATRETTVIGWMTVEMLFDQLHRQLVDRGFSVENTQLFVECVKPVHQFITASPRMLLWSCKLDLFQRNYDYLVEHGFSVENAQHFVESIDPSQLRYGR